LKIQASYETEQAIGIDLDQILKNTHSKFDLILQDGDRLEIPKELQTVRLSGAFLYPITVRYDKNYGFNKYAAMAGGFTEDALPKNTYVIYANGSIDRTSSFMGIKYYPTIEPGSEIVVPKKIKLKNQMSALEVVSIASAISSISLVAITIVKTVLGK
jgi:hypothetical protein